MVGFILLLKSPYIRGVEVKYEINAGCLSFMAIDTIYFG